MGAVVWCAVCSEQVQITRRSVNPGDNVAVGQSLMADRSLSEVWIDTSFKENQISYLRIGQSVDLHVDAYPGKIFYGRGEIDGWFDSRFIVTLMVIAAVCLVGAVFWELRHPRSLKSRPETNRAVDQATIVSKLKDGADTPHGVAKPYRTPALRHLVAEGGEVICPQIFHNAGLAEARNEKVADYQGLGGLVEGRGRGRITLRHSNVSCNRVAVFTANPLMPGWSGYAFYLYWGIWCKV